MTVKRCTVSLLISIYIVSLQIVKLAGFLTGELGESIQQCNIKRIGGCMLDLCSAKKSAGAHLNPPPPLIFLFLFTYLY